MEPKQKKRWSDFSPPQKAAIIVLGTAEVVFTVTALRDLRRRPADQIRGPKVLWVLGSFVQPVGAPAYLIWGRRRDRR